MASPAGTKIKAKAPKLPKGYKPTYTTYKLTTETYFDKPYKAPKAAKGKPTEYVQKVRVVNPGALKGGRKKGR